MLLLFFWLKNIKRWQKDDASVGYFCWVLPPGTSAGFFLQVIPKGTPASYFCWVLPPATSAKYFQQVLLPDASAKYFHQVLLPGSAGVCANCTTCSWETLTIPTSQLVAEEHGLFGGHESEVIRSWKLCYLRLSRWILLPTYILRKYYSYSPWYIYHLLTKDII